MEMKISEKAEKFLREKGIEDVTFRLVSMKVAGCMGMVREIEPKYDAPKDAREYRYYKTGGCHVFVSRYVRILGPLTLSTEGLWKMKRLCLEGVTVPI